MIHFGGVEYCGRPAESPNGQARCELNYELDGEEGRILPSLQHPRAPGRDCINYGVRRGDSRAPRKGHRRWRAIAYLHSFSSDRRQHFCHRMLPAAAAVFAAVFRGSIMLNCQLELAGAVAAAAARPLHTHRMAHIYRECDAIIVAKIVMTSTPTPPEGTTFAQSVNFASIKINNMHYQSIRVP